MLHWILDDDFVPDLQLQETESCEQQSENEEIICSGRGRHLRSPGTVPRLPHAAFIIKKQIENEEYNQGRRKRGRGRASLIRQTLLNAEANKFLPRMPFTKVADDKIDDGAEQMPPVDINRPSDTCLDLQSQEEYPDLPRNDQALQKGENDPISKQKSSVHGGSSDANSDRSSIRELARARREKERQNQKESFAEINRQMFSELASTFHDKDSYKPVKLMRLTKANLEQHVRETEDVLRMSEAISQKEKVNTGEGDLQLYEEFGVTLDDIWLFKQNKFKMPQGVKNKVNEINLLSQLLNDDNGNGEHSEQVEKVCNIDKENDQHVDSDGDKEALSQDNEHEKQVNFLSMLYDEDSWSNQKELSVSSAGDILEDSENNSNSLKTDQEKSGDNPDKCDGVDAIPCDEISAIEETNCDEKNYNDRAIDNLSSDKMDKTVDNILTDKGIPDENHVDTSYVTESANTSFFSVASDLDVTVKYQDNKANYEMDISGISDEDNVGSVRPKQEHNENLNKNKVSNKLLSVGTDGSSSKQNSEVNESSIEIIDSDLSLSKDLNVDCENIVLYSESSNVTSESVAAVLKDESDSTDSGEVRGVGSSVALLDEFDIPEPVTDKSNSALEVTQIESENSDEFIVVNSKGKKHKKKQVDVSANIVKSNESKALQDGLKSKLNKNQGKHAKHSETGSHSVDKNGCEKDNKNKKGKCMTDSSDKVSNKDEMNKSKSQGNSQTVSNKLNNETVSTQNDKSNQSSEMNEAKCETNGAVGTEESENMDDFEGFQVVKKKQRKKKEEPKTRQRKHDGKQENTIWKLYGKNVIQVAGLPVDFDVETLTMMVSGFGTVQDYQVREIEDLLAVRYRLHDEDSCVYAVTCLDKSDIGSSEGLLSCSKLTN